jgi:hypothetical protein
MNSYILQVHCPLGDDLEEGRHIMEKPTQSSSTPTVASNPMPGRQAAARIGLEEFIEAASNAVLRVTEARRVDESFPFKIPIVLGIIFLPGLGGDLGQEQLITSPAKEEAR